MPSIIIEAKTQKQLDAFIRACPEATKHKVKITDDKPLVIETQQMIKIVDNKKAYLWNDGNTGHLIIAKDDDEAFRILFAARLSAAGAKQDAIDAGTVDSETVEDCLRWHQKNDSLEEITSYITDAPYSGEIPDEDDE